MSQPRTRTTQRPKHSHTRSNSLPAIRDYHTLTRGPYHIPALNQSMALPLPQSLALSPHHDPIRQPAAPSSRSVGAYAPKRGPRAPNRAKSHSMCFVSFHRPANRPDHCFPPRSASPACRRYVYSMYVLCMYPLRRRRVRSDLLYIPTTCVRAWMGSGDRRTDVCTLACGVLLTA